MHTIGKFLSVAAAMLLCATASATATAVQVVLSPVADATLIEDLNGARANGAASAFYVDKTQRDGFRRALLRFDPAGKAW